MNNCSSHCGITEFKSELDKFYNLSEQCKTELEKPITIWETLFKSHNQKCYEVGNKILVGLNNLNKKILEISLLEEDISLEKRSFTQICQQIKDIRPTLVSLFPELFKKDYFLKNIKIELDNILFKSNVFDCKIFEGYLDSFKILLDNKNQFNELMRDMKFKYCHKEDFIIQILKITDIVSRIQKSYYPLCCPGNHFNKMHPKIIEDLNLNELRNQFYYMIGLKFNTWRQMIKSCSIDSWHEHVLNYLKLINGISTENQFKYRETYEFLIKKSDLIFSDLTKQMFEGEYFHIKSSLEICTKMLIIYMEKKWRALAIDPNSNEQELVLGINKFINQFKKGMFSQFELDICRGGFNFEIFENSKSLGQMLDVESILKSENNMSDYEYERATKKVLQSQLTRLQKALKIKENNRWFFPLLMILNNGTIVSACGDLFTLNPCLADSLREEFMVQALKLDVERPSVFTINLIKDKNGVIEEINISLPYSMFCYQGNRGSEKVIKKDLITGSIQFSLKLGSDHMPYIENFKSTRNWSLYE